MVMKIFFMDRCPKDAPTGKNLVYKKALPISQKNWKNLLGGGGINPPGHRRVTNSVCSEIDLQRKTGKSEIFGVEQ